MGWESWFTICFIFFINKMDMMFFHRMLKMINTVGYLGIIILVTINLVLSAKCPKGFSELCGPPEGCQRSCTNPVPEDRCKALPCEDGCFCPKLRPIQVCTWMLIIFYRIHFYPYLNLFQCQIPIVIIKNVPKYKTKYNYIVLKLVPYFGRFICKA